MPILSNSRCRNVLIALILTVPVLLTACSSPEPKTTVPLADKSISQKMPQGHELLPDKQKPDISQLPSEQELGMPLYPGATPYNGPGGIPNNMGSGGGITTALLQTNDTTQTVIEYYKTRLTLVGPTGKPETPKAEEITLDNKPAVILSQTDRTTQSVKTVEVRRGDGITVIELMRIEGAKSGVPIDLPAHVSDPNGGLTPDAALPANTSASPRTSGIPNNVPNKIGTHSQSPFSDSTKSGPQKRDQTIQTPKELSNP